MEGAGKEARERGGRAGPQTSGIVGVRDETSTHLDQRLPLLEQVFDLR